MHASLVVDNNLVWLEGLRDAERCVGGCPNVPQRYREFYHPVAVSRSLVAHYGLIVRPEKHGVHGHLLEGTLERCHQLGACERCTVCMNEERSRVSMHDRGELLPPGMHTQEVRECPM